MGLLKGFIDNQKIKKFKETEAKARALGLINVVGTSYYPEGVLNVISNRNIPLNKWTELPCKLEPEPKNEHDPNAVKVMARDAAGTWQLIGYISAELCESVKGLIGDGVYYYLLAKPDSKETTGFTFRVKLFI